MMGSMCGAWNAFGRASVNVGNYANSLFSKGIILNLNEVWLWTFLGVTDQFHRFENHENQTSL